MDTTRMHIRDGPLIIFGGGDWGGEFHFSIFPLGYGLVAMFFAQPLFRYLDLGTTVIKIGSVKSKVSFRWDRDERYHSSADF